MEADLVYLGEVERSVDCDPSITYNTFIFRARKPELASCGVLRCAVFVCVSDGKEVLEVFNLR